MQNLSRGASVAVDAIALSQLKRTDFESQNSRWAPHRVGCSAEPITGAAVPDLTYSAGIKLNARIALLAPRELLSSPKSCGNGC
jgi:hypothetical protein